MFALLAFRSLLDRPLRTAFLLFGYACGVGVMITLLSIGEALMLQASDEKLVGGGEITVLPEGVDIEVLKTGGVGGMFFSIDHARFIHRQLLAGPRLAAHVAAAAPQLDGKLLYLRTADGRETPVRAGGEIPSLQQAVGAAPALTAGTWDDDDGDRRWRSPTPAELRHEVDHFHLPPPEARGDSTWAEWHYFNVLSADRRRWAFISFIVGGDVPDGRWGGQVLVTLHEQGARRPRRFAATIPPREVEFSTSRADVRLGPSSVRVLPDGDYAVRARATEDGTGVPLELDLVVRPAPRQYFPSASLGGTGIVSGYTVPALRADADGSLCIAGRCDRYADAPAYHDHNWGVWRGVTWEWGAGRAGEFSLLYGRVEQPDSVAAVQPLFLYVVDSLGFVALFRPRQVAYEDGGRVPVPGGTLAVPSRGSMVDVRGADTLRLDLTVDDATATDTRRPGAERGDAGSSRTSRPWFIQMKGRTRLSGRVAGRVIRGEGVGFFETYR